jgi:hypothetical protein
MAITQQDVYQIADTLEGKGEVLTARAIREVYGSGSLSTISKYLRSREAAKAESGAQASDLPADLQAKGLEYISALWAHADREAQREVRRTKDAAAAEVARVHAMLDEEGARIEQQDALLLERASALQQTQAQLHDRELALAAAQARGDELEKANATLRMQLDAERADAKAQTLEIGRLTAELAATLKKS